MDIALSLFALIIFTLLSGALSIAYYRKIWNPIFLFVFMFLIGCLFEIVDKSNAVDLSNAFFWILIGEFIFVLSFLTTQTFFNRRSTDDSDNAIYYNWNTIDRLLTFCLIIAFASLLLNIYVVMQVASSFADIFIDSTRIRFLYLQRTTSTWVALLSLLLSFNFFTTFCLFPLALQNARKWSGVKLIIVLAIRLLSSLVTMSKEAFLLDIIVFISAYMLTIKDKKSELKFYRKYGLLFLILIIILLIVISIQRSYIGNQYNSYGEAVLGTIQSYISVSINGFAQLLDLNNITFTDGQLCFRPIINVLSYLGIGNRVSAFQSSVSNNINVYTIFGNMYRDFGYPGIIGLSVVFGAFLGLIYNTNRKYRLSGLVANSIVTMTMFFGYYDLKIIQTIYLFVMIYAVVFDKLLQRKLYAVSDVQVTTTN